MHPIVVLILSAVLGLISNVLYFVIAHWIQCHFFHK